MQSLDPGRYTIAWIAPLEIESRAAACMLDREHVGRFPMQRGDDYIYQAGEICGHNVVIATLPAGQEYGTGSAAALASQVKKYFPNLWFGLLVGVAAGLPKLTEPSPRDIRLGDVLVALPEGDSAGLIAYGLGKETTSDGFQLLREGHVFAMTEPVVRAAIGSIKRRAPNDAKLILPYYEQIKDTEHDRGTFADPGQDADQLWQMNGTGSSKVVQRERRSDERRTRIWYGPIGSGDKLLKNAMKRDKLRDRYNLIGLEMEAAGTMNRIPVGVIRGVCDYGDEQKNKYWQPYASAMAAAYAKALLAQIGPQGPKSEELKRPWFLVPYPRNNNFVGRVISEQLKQLALGSASQVRVSLFGLGGTGKTQIALEYVYWLQETYPALSVFWVHASNAERFGVSYASIAQECHISGYDDPSIDVLQLVKGWLESKKHGQWLMVVDNADDLQLFSGQPSTFGPSPEERASKRNFGRILPECSHGAILVTTRNKQVGVRLAKGRQAIEVPRMIDKESECLVHAMIEDNGATPADISMLSSQLEHLPLALAQAASYIQETSISVRKYLQLIGSSDREVVYLLSKEFETVGRDSEAPQAVAQTWMLSFHQIERQNALASELLSVMSLLDRHDIPAPFLSHYVGQKQHMGPRSDAELTEALGVLKAFSFVTEEKDGSFDIHRLVQLVTRKWLTNQDTMSRYKTDVLDTMAHLYPYGTYETRTTCAAYLPHANALLELGGFTTGDALKKASLLHCMAAYLDFEGQWTDAERCSTEAVALRRGLFGVEHPSTLKSMVKLASTYRSQGRWDEAERLQVQVMETSKTKLGAGHLLTLKSMASLALTYRHQGRWNKAERLQVQVMETRKRKLGSDHPLTLVGMENLGLTYWNQGRWDEAERLQMQVMEAYKMKSGPNHPSTLTSMASLALTYGRQGRWDEAERLQVQVMETRKTKLGADHPDTLKSIANLAATYSNQDWWDKAERLFMDVMGTIKTKLGGDHPDTLTTMANLAAIYGMQGWWDKAETLEVQVMETSKTKLGVDHPDTLISMANLALTYRRQGRWDEAERLNVQVMETRKMKLGADHPNTLITMANLAHIYWSQDRLPEAVDLMRRCVKVQKAKLGARHPHHRSDNAVLAQWVSGLNIVDTSSVAGRALAQVE